MKLNFRRNNKIYHSWLISYFSFLIYTLIFSVLIISYSKGIVETEISKTNEEIFSSIENQVNTSKNNMDKIALYLSYTKEFIHFFNTPSLQGDTWEYYLLSQALDTLHIQYPDIDEIALFIPNEDILISSAGISSMDLIYTDYIPIDLVQSGQNTSYDDWKNLMKKRFTQNIYQNDQKDLLYFNSYPLSSNSVKGVFLFKVYEETMDRTFAPFTLNGNKILTLMNESNDVIWQSAPNVDIEFAHGLKELPLNQKGITYMSKWLCFTTKYQSNVKSIYSIDKKHYWNELNDFILITILLVLMLTLLGIIFAVFLTKKQYRPVKKLLSMIPSQKGNSTTPENNEFEYISSSFAEILEHSRNNISLKNKYQNISFQTTFINFFRDNRIKISCAELFEQYNIDFNHAVYAVTLISINDIDDNFGFIDNNDEHEQNLIELAIVNVYQELLEEASLLELRLDSNMVICIIGFEKNDYYENIIEITKQTQVVLKENLGIAFSAMISENFTSLHGIKKAYFQTMDMYAYNDTLDVDVIAYKDCHWANAESDVSADNLQLLSNMILSGSTQDATEYLSQHLKMEQPQLQISSKLKYIKYELVSIFVKLLKQGQVHNDEKFLEMLSAMEQSMTLQALFHTSTVIIQQLCYIFSNRDINNREQLLSNKIKEYVKNNYSDINLNVNSLGMMFDLTPGYLSKIFKQQTGEILRDYIINIRLSQSQILLSTKAKIDDIAIKCGFSDGSSFSRTFKKHFGISPGKYRMIT